MKTKVQTDIFNDKHIKRIRIKYISLKKYCFFIFLCSFFFIVSNCVKLPKIDFNESLFSEFPQDSAVFSTQYNAKVETIKRGKESLGNIIIKTDGLIAVFGDDKIRNYKLRYIKVSKQGIVKIKDTDFIGKKSEEIIRIFGEPKNKTTKSYSYEDNSVFCFLYFKFTNEIVSEWIMGYNP